MSRSSQPQPFDLWGPRHNGVFGYLGELRSIQFSKHLSHHCRSSLDGVNGRVGYVIYTPQKKGTWKHFWGDMCFSKLEYMLGNVL